MDDNIGLARSVASTFAGYPFYVARTLIQIGYEPKSPDEFGFKFYLPAEVMKQASYDLMASVINHKKDTLDSDASEIIAVCLRESALKIHSTLITYPLLTLSVSCISTAFFDTNEPLEFTVQNLYKGIVPRLIFEVVMVWVSILSRRLAAHLIDDIIGQTIVSRVPSFIVQAFLHPLNVVTTVMADQGRSRVNPKFDNWMACFTYLKATNQLKRGSSLLFRRDYQHIIGSRYSIKRYF